MGRFFILLAVIAVLLLVVRHWRQKKKYHSVRRAKKSAVDGRKIKSKGRLVRDPKTGEYHAEPDDEDQDDQ